MKSGVLFRAPPRSRQIYRIESRHPPGTSRHNCRYQRYDKREILYWRKVNCVCLVMLLAIGPLCVNFYL